MMKVHNATYVKFYFPHNIGFQELEDERQWKQSFRFAGGVLGCPNVKKHMIITVGIFRFVFNLF